MIFNNFGDVYFEGLCVVGCWKSRTHFTNITFLLLSFWMYNYTITHFLSQRFCGRQFFFLIPLIPSITPLSELNYFCFLLICCEPLDFFFQPLVHYEHHNKNYIPNGPLLVLERCNFFFLYRITALRKYTHWKSFMRQLSRRAIERMRYFTEMSHFDA